MSRPTIRVAGTPEAYRQVTAWPGETPLGRALAECGFMLTDPADPGLMGLPLRAVQLSLVDVATLGPGQPLYRPAVEPGPASATPGPGTAGPAPGGPAPAGTPSRPAPGPGRPGNGRAGLGNSRPAEISDETATQLAYSERVEEVAAFLRAGLSVLVMCEKAVVRYLAEHIVRSADLEALMVEANAADSDEQGAGPLGLVAAPASLGQREMAQLRDLIRARKDGQVIVIPHMDLLAGSADGFMPASSDVRELIELLYTTPDAVILAFADPSLAITEVLAARFSRRLSIEGSSRTILMADGSEVPIERALVTQAEAERFRGIDDTDFYKYVVGLNPVRIREAMRFATLALAGRAQVSADDLYDTIRIFKAHRATGFEIPRVKFDDIGGYANVKRELKEALQIMQEARDLPTDDRDLLGTLVPRGFIFHGPPGTGKTLFAKAVATEMKGTIQVVSGPEVTSKWVGEGERKVRDLFAEGRRNAPSVIVFDEFDSIAARRTSGFEDGGSRAANAMVAQILTEMDGFRPDVQMIVIGTTNRLDMIDKALLRPSRFRSFHIDWPDPEARREIVMVHARDHHIDIGPDVVEAIADATDKWNGDEIRSIFREAYVARWLRQDTSDTETLLAAIVAHIGMAKQGEHVSERRH